MIHDWKTVEGSAFLRCALTGMWTDGSDVYSEEPVPLQVLVEPEPEPEPESEPEAAESVED